MNDSYTATLEALPARDPVKTTTQVVVTAVFLSPVAGLLLGLAFRIFTWAGGL